MGNFREPHLILYRELQSRLEQLVDAYDRQMEQRSFFKENLEKLLKETEDQKLKIEELERENVPESFADKRIQLLQNEIEALREQLANAQVSIIEKNKN